MFPIRDTTPSKHFPAAVVAVIGLNVFAFFYQLWLNDRQLDFLVHFYGVLPARYTHPVWASRNGLSPLDLKPFITCMFLHGGWLHIIGNMWTLWIFGDNVEDRMGPAKFLSFYLLCGICATMTHMLFNAGSTMPIIGASGAIAGVLAAYMRLIPWGRVLVVIPILFIPLFLQVPAFIYMIVWFWTQVYSGAFSMLSSKSGGGIAWWAHIGGFLAGFFLYKYFLSKSRAERRS